MEPVTSLTAPPPVRIGTAFPAGPLPGANRFDYPTPIFRVTVNKVRAMFAIVRTGGKQYRVAAGDRIVVDRMDGDAGARITLGDVLFTSTGASGITVAAEVVAQAKAEKVIVFKKKRRHNYRRKNGHRQQLTILKILSVGDTHAEEKQAKPVAVETAPVAVDAAPVVAAPVDVDALVPAPEPVINESTDLQATEPVKKAATKKAATKKAGAAKPAAEQE